MKSVAKSAGGDGGESKYQQMKTSEGEPPQIAAAALQKSTTIKNVLPKVLVT